MIWTDAQREVIEKRNSDILVSAAAGSGKTAVLVERIISLVCDENDPADRQVQSHADGVRREDKGQSPQQAHLASAIPDT